jgi:hypothetical protein
VPEPPVADAVNVVAVPEQIAVLLPAFTVIPVLTDIVAEAVEVQEFALVSVTVYTPAVDAVTELPEEVPAGVVQLKVPEPEAVSVVLVPEQIAVFPEIVVGVFGLTVT